MHKRGGKSSIRINYGVCFILAFLLVLPLFLLLFHFMRVSIKSFCPSRQDRISVTNRKSGWTGPKLNFPWNTLDGVTAGAVSLSRRTLDALGDKLLSKAETIHHSHSERELSMFPLQFGNFVLSFLSLIPLNLSLFVFPIIWLIFNSIALLEIDTHMLSHYTSF